MHVSTRSLLLLSVAGSIQLAAAQCPSEGYFPTTCSVCVKSGKQPAAPPSSFTGTRDQYMTNVYINVMSGTQDSSAGLVKDDWNVPQGGGTRGLDCICQGSVSAASSGSGCQGSRNECRNAGDPSAICLVTTERTNNPVTVQQGNVQSNPPSGWTDNPFGAASSSSSSASSSSTTASSGSSTTTTDTAGTSIGTTDTTTSSSTVPPATTTTESLTGVVPAAQTSSSATPSVIADTPTTTLTTTTDTAAAGSTTTSIATAPLNGTDTALIPTTTLTNATSTLPLITGPSPTLFTTTTTQLNGGVIPTFATNQATATAQATSPASSGDIVRNKGWMMGGLMLIAGGVAAL
ncbi:hypothetical protein HDV00_000011 [Rhizophlyctis rosea]|nr:hypothetical protein HDV00_000011 [Rhizophlyctis rosea]